MGQRDAAKTLAVDALAVLEVEIRGFEHGRGYLLKLESSDVMPELAQVGAQAGCSALLDLAGCNAGVDVVGGILVERPRGSTHEVAMVELVVELTQRPLGLGSRAVEVLCLLMVFSSVWAAPEACPSRAGRWSRCRYLSPCRSPPLSCWGGCARGAIDVHLQLARTASCDGCHIMAPSFLATTWIGHGPAGIASPVGPFWLCIFRSYSGIVAPLPCCLFLVCRTFRESSVPPPLPCRPAPLNRPYIF